MSKQTKLFMKIILFQLLVVFIGHLALNANFIMAMLCLVIGTLFFRYVLFKKECDYLINGSFYDFRHRSSSTSLPRLTKEKIAFYEQTGLTEEEVKFFREQLAKAKQHIHSIEYSVGQQSKLTAIERRYATLKIMKDYFKEIKANPLQLTHVGDFLYHYLPTLDELSKKYIEINKHVTKSHQTYETLESTANAIEEISQKIESDYIEFQKRDIVEAEIEMETLHEKKDNPIATIQASDFEYEDF